MKKQLGAVLLTVALAVSLGLVPFGGQQASADINSNLQGYWRFDTNANDFSGNGNNGALFNGAATTGMSAPVSGDGASVSLDGVNDYVSVSDHATLDFGAGDFTVAAWLWVSKSDLDTNKEYGVVNKNSTYQSTPGWGIEVHTYSPGSGGDFAVSFYITSQTAWGNTNAAKRDSSMTADAWHHITGVRAGTTTSLYFDGDLVKTKTHDDADDNVDNSQPVIIADHSWGPMFPGLIDEVRLYARALTEQEIGMLADEGSVALSPNVDFNPINASHTVTAEIDADGSDVTDPYTVNFKVTGGPNSGDSAEVDTDAAGDVDDADFSYTGDGGFGIDQITAWIDIDLDDQIDSGEPQATITKYWLEHFVTGGGIITEGTDKNAAKITFGGNVGFDLSGNEVGQWNINIHNVNDPDFDKGHFHSTEITDIGFFDIVDCPEPGPPDADYNYAHFVATGRFNGEDGWKVRFNMTDYGEGNKLEPDGIRVRLWNPTDPNPVFDSSETGEHYLGVFTNEGTCAIARRTRLDGGNIQIHPPEIPTP